MCVGGWLVNFLPFFLMENTLFLYHYLPAYTFLLQLLPAVLEHAHTHLLRYTHSHTQTLPLSHQLKYTHTHTDTTTPVIFLFFSSSGKSQHRAGCVSAFAGLCSVYLCYKSFSPLTYGSPELSANQLQALRWQPSWDILYRRP